MNDPRYGGYDGQSTRRQGPGCNVRLIGAVVMALIAFVTYQSNVQVNPVTGEKQRVSMSADQEIALGLNAAPEMAAQHGGAVEGPDAQLVRAVGNRIVQRTVAAKSPYKFQFHLLRDPETINAFALPGGQVFITRGLLSKLDTEAQLAGVLGHEIGHVIGRHGAEHMAKAQLMNGLSGAAVMATYDPSNPSSAQKAAMAQMAAQLINLKYGRDDETEADTFGLELMVKAGYDPRGMLGVMKVLEDAMKGNSQPEWMSSHPNPGNRYEATQAWINRTFPNGVPRNLTP